VKRWLTLLGITAALALGLGVAIPADAARAITPAGAPDPISILPSVVKGAFSGVGPKQLGSLYQILYGYALKGSLADAARVAAKANAAPIVKPPVFTEAQLAAKAAAKLKFKIPATKLNPIMKGGAGTAGVAMVGYQVGVWAGQGIMSVVGIDEAGSVCGQGKGFEIAQNLITGLDCDAWTKANTYTANMGTPKTIAGWKNREFWWGGTAAEDTWGGLASGAPVGNTGEWKMSATFVPAKWGMDAEGSDASSAVQSFCQWQGGAKAGQLVMGFGSVPAGFSGGVSKTATFACPLGSLLFALGRPASEGGVAIGTYADGNAYGPIARLTNGGSLQYFTPLSPLYVPESDGNPSRRFECVVAGSDGVTYTSTTVDFKELDANWPTPECKPLPEDVFPVDTKINEVGGNEVHEVQAQPTTPEYQHVVENFPECMSGSCMLDLEKIGVGSCFDHPTDCAGWFEDPNKTDKYVCRYNGKVVDFAECTVYAPTFQPEKQGVGDPVTGEPVPLPDFETLPGVYNPPKTDPSTARDDCFPSGWGVLNPVEWVLKPVGCALTTAFVPRPEVVQAKMNGVRSEWEETAPFKLSAVIGTLQFDLPDESCTGIPVSLGFLPANVRPPDSRFFAACPGDMMYPVATVIKISIGTIFTLLAAWSIAASIAGTVAFRGIAD
jgi:hypothetical protein